MNIVSCHGFAKYQQTTVILTCCSALVSHYNYKGFFIFETKDGGLDNVAINVQKKMNAVDKQDGESVLVIKSLINL